MCPRMWLDSTYREVHKEICWVRKWFPCTYNIVHTVDKGLPLSRAFCFRIWLEFNLIVTSVRKSSCAFFLQLEGLAVPLDTPENKLVKNTLERLETHLIYACPWSSSITSHFLHYSQASVAVIVCIISVFGSTVTTTIRFHYFTGPITLIWFLSIINRPFWNPSLHQESNAEVQLSVLKSICESRV